MLIILSVCSLIVASCPMSFAQNTVINVETWDDVTSAITNATTDTTINLTKDIESPSSVYVYNSQGSNKITITSSTSNILTLGNTLNINCDGAYVILKNMTVKSAGAISVTNGTLELDNVNLSVLEGKTANMGVNVGANGRLFVYGGSYKGFGTASIQANQGPAVIIPKNTIEIDKLRVGTFANASCDIKPEESTQVTVKWDGQDPFIVTSDSPYSFANDGSKYQNLSIELNSNKLSATVTADTSAVGKLYPGTEFSVPVTIADNPGIVGATFAPVYDSSVFEYVSFTKGNALGGTFEEDKSSGNVNYSAASSDVDDTGNGTVGTYTFKVKESAEPGDYSIGISSDDFSNAALDDVNVNLVSGSVTVEAVPAGYSVDVSAESDTVEQNQIAKINLDITNPDTQIYNDTQLELTYDSTNFEFAQSDSTIPEKFNVATDTETSPATLTIKGYGDDLDLKEDSKELVLAFKAIGNAGSTGDFQLTTAKIDQASHANENVVDATYPENPVTVTIEEAVPETELKVETSDYVIAERTGEYTLIKATVINPVEGQIPTYNGEAMFKMTNVGSEKTYDEDAYYYVVKTADYKKDLVILGEQSEVTIDKANLADPNCTGVTDINDAQFVYNLYNTSTITVTYPVSAKQLLASDVNGDGSIQTSDCAAVIAKL